MHQEYTKEIGGRSNMAVVKKTLVVWKVI